MGPVLVLLSLLAALVAPVSAQKRKVPERPGAVADTNDTRAYYQIGLTQMEAEPEEAVAALYWATQLEPSWAAALYARRVAELRADESKLIRYMRGDKKARRELAPSDSLLYRARMLEPFLAQDLDRGLVLHYLRASVTREVRRQNPNAPQGEIAYAVDTYLKELLVAERDPELLGWLAFSDRRLPDALRYYGKAIAKTKKKEEAAGIYDNRATAFFMLQAWDSAAAQLQLAIEGVKTENEKDTEVIYRPGALLFYRLAHVQIRAERLHDARQSLARALEEDLAFYPAHMTLATLALATADTATAIREIQLAVDLQPTEALPFMRYADLQASVGNDSLARAALLAVVEMAPYYAAPHLELARLADRTGARDEAIRYYQNFLVRAPRADRGAAEVRKRLAELGGS